MYIHKKIFISIVISALFVPTCAERNQIYVIKELSIENDKACYQTQEILKDGQYTLIAVMNKKCALCNDNMAMWNKIADIKAIKTIGIVLNTEKLESYNQSGLFNFPIYSPVDINNFKENFLFNNSQSLTILCLADKVIFQRLGLIGLKHFWKIKQQIRSDK